MNNHQHQGKHVFVAGGSSGINLGIAKAFVLAGAHVAIASRSADRVAAAVSELMSVASEGVRVLGFSADVRDAEAIGKALADAHAALGDIDVLVSGAAGNFVAPALGMSPNGFATVVDIDLKGTFNVMRQAHVYLRMPGASLISISASQSYTPTKYQAHVCAAKAGVDMLTRVLALEWGEQGIRINSIVPGPIGDTEGIRRLAPTPEAMQRMNDTVPLKRLGKLTDVSDMALFLCSAQASYVTGAVIPVDGGISLVGGRDLSAGLVGR